jgi:exopolysaccharide biosynthesis polyprenyl glycosylphosphotransferase
MQLAGEADLTELGLLTPVSGGIFSSFPSEHGITFRRGSPELVRGEIVGHGGGIGLRHGRGSAVRAASNGNSSNGSSIGVAPEVSPQGFIPVRAAGLAQTGRALALSLPVVLTVALVDRHTPGRLLVAAIVLGLIWYACVNLSFAAGRTTLATLGPYVPVMRGVLLGLIVTTAFGVWLPWLRLGTQATLALSGAILTLVAGWEAVVARWLTTPTRLLIVGPREACQNLIRELADARDGRFRLVGIIDDEKSVDTGPLVLGGTSEIQRIVETIRPDLVALAPGCNRPETFAQLLEAASAGFRVLEMAQFYEYAFGRVPVRDLTRAWFMSVLHLYQRPYSKFVKRAGDLFGAVLLLVVAAPIFPLLILLVRSTPGPVFLRQVRVGEHGRHFAMYKFRTMRADAERPGQAVWASQNDPRVTAAGRVIRRLRLDELPQIWNVLKGEMSIVGPRPERPEFIDELESVPFWTRRHLVKPGITGWAQVKRGYTADAEGSLEKLSYDLWYIRHRSLTVDLAICCYTLAAVLQGERRARRTEVAGDIEPDPVFLRHRGDPHLEADPVAEAGF